MGYRRWASVSRGLTATMPIAFAYTLIVLLIITSFLLMLLILLHRGKGGGLSSMFGGGVSTSLAGSSVAEKNLDRYTILVGIVWFACIVGLGLWLKLAMNS
jgi:preprotein translocase subunit SecG